MSLKKIFEEVHIDELEKGDRVKFVPEEVIREWDNEYTFLGRTHRFRISFIVPSKEEKAIYLMEFNRGNLFPTKAGFIRMQERQTFACEKITLLHHNYETYKELIEEGKN